MRHLGIDYGTKKIGLALSDEAGTMGFPHGIVQNDSRALGEIEKLVKSERVERTVMGESIAPSGQENPVAKDARAFVEELSQRTGVAAVFEPEMYTTQEARRDFEGVHISRGGNVDASAAALILTSYLSRDHE